MGVGLTLLTMFQCQNDPEKEYITKTDTVTTTTVVHDTVTVHKPKLVHDTAFVVYDVDRDRFIHDELYKMRFYERTYRDTNMIIRVQDSIVGYLMDRNVAYRILLPIKRVDSVFITKSSVKPFKYEIKGGLDLTKTNAFISTDLEVNRHTFQVGYDPFNKQAKLGYKYTIFRK